LVAIGGATECVFQLSVLYFGVPFGRDGILSVFYPIFELQNNIRLQLPGWTELHTATAPMLQRWASVNKIKHYYNE
jgi:hypothetical protein